MAARPLPGQLRGRGPVQVPSSTTTLVAPGPCLPRKTHGCCHRLGPHPAPPPRFAPAPAQSLGPAPVFLEAQFCTGDVLMYVNKQTTPPAPAAWLSPPEQGLRRGVAGTEQVRYGAGGCIHRGMGAVPAPMASSPA